jgi:hypothetical protein
MIAPFLRDIGAASRGSCLRRYTYQSPPILAGPARSLLPGQEAFSRFRNRRSRDCTLPSITWSPMRATSPPMISGSVCRRRSTVLTFI